MKGLQHYIIEIKEPFSKTFKTESGLELYANKDFSADRLSNRLAIVKEIPFLFEGAIEIGDEVIIDPTILYEQIYQGVKQESIHLMDREKMLFKIEPNLIILYRRNNEEWKGFLNNLFVKPIKKQSEKLISKYIFTEEVKEEYEKGKAIVTYCNDEIIEQGVQKNDMVAISPNGGLPYWLDGVEYWWLRISDVLGKYE